jgi:SAM-dependent methyltransferase
MVKSRRSTSGLRDLIPSALQPAAREIYYTLFRFLLRLRFWWADRVGWTKIEPPVPPAILRYRVGELLSVDRFLQIGEACAGLIQQCVNDMGVDFANAQRALDFGCGCGRTIRWFLRKYSGEFHGLDVDAEAIDWCKQYLQPGRFLANAPDPPLPYPAEHFDVVYCLSVFTHLNESMQDAWLGELNRILRPDGVLVLTIFSKNARERLDAEGQRELRAAGFVHRRSQKLKGLVPDWYHTTLHSPEYMMDRLSTSFEMVRYLEVPGGMQDVITAKKTKIAAS